MCVVSVCSSWHRLQSLLLLLTDTAPGPAGRTRAKAMDFGVYGLGLPGRTASGCEPCQPKIQIPNTRYYRYLRCTCAAGLCDNQIPSAAGALGPRRALVCHLRQRRRAVAGDGIDAFTSPGYLRPPASPSSITCSPLPTSTWVQHKDCNTGFGWKIKNTY